MTDNRVQKGFTLVEMLIVIGLIAVLLGVGIPVASTALQESQAKSCDAKCRALENEANAKVMNETESELPPADNDPLNDHASRRLEGNDKEAKARAALEELPEDYRTLCPAGGDIAIYPDLDGNIHLVCSIHGKGVIQYFNPVDSMTNGFQTLKNNSATISTKIDSTSSNGPNILAMFPYLPSFGSHNIATWSIKNSEENDRTKRTMKYIVWSDIDIRALSTGTTVPVMRYNVSDGTYEVWTMRVTNCNDNNETYRVLNHASNNAEYKKSAEETDKSKLTFEQALTWYDAAKAELHYQ